MQVALFWTFTSFALRSGLCKYVTYDDEGREIHTLLAKLEP